MTTTPNTLNLIRVKDHKIGTHKGHDRIYLQGEYLKKAGFEPSLKVRMEIKEESLEIILDDSGTTTISKKIKNEQVKPVIDILSDVIKSKIGEEAEIITYKGKIVIRPILSERCRRDRDKKNTGKTFVDLYSGGSLFGEACKLHGYKKVAVIEHNQKYADVAEVNSESDTVIFNQDVRNIDLEILKKLGKINLVVVGQPCEAFSNSLRSGKNYNKGTVPESHEQVGDLIYYTMRVLEILNPEKIILECGKNFLESGSFHILNGFLRHRKYFTKSQAMNSADYGSIQARERAVVVASKDEFQLPEKFKSEMCVNDFLDLDGKHEWFDENSKRWLYDHWRKQTKKGNGFSNGLIFDGSEQTMRVLKKRYMAQQGDNPVIANDNGTKHRWLTVKELRNLFEVPKSYILDVPKTVAGEILGQGIIVGFFSKIIKCLENSNNISDSSFEKNETNTQKIKTNFQPMLFDF